MTVGLLWKIFVPSSSLKLPCRINAVGTSPVCVCTLRYRAHSCPKKKNILPFGRMWGIITGPPILKPNWLYRKGDAKFVSVLVLRDHVSVSYTHLTLPTIYSV